MNKNTFRLHLLSRRAVPRRRPGATCPLISRGQDNSPPELPIRSSTESGTGRGTTMAATEDRTDRRGDPCARQPRGEAAGAGAVVRSRG